MVSKICFACPTSGNDPIWLLFLKVETKHYMTWYSRGSIVDQSRYIVGFGLCFGIPVGASCYKQRLCFPNLKTSWFSKYVCVCSCLHCQGHAISYVVYIYVPIYHILLNIYVCVDIALINVEPKNWVLENHFSNGLNIFRFNVNFQGCTFHVK